tara:strand:+ start:733 stop:2019 length:1287 start_codon:yes stop_codon:yes gene_type:complete
MFLKGDHYNLRTSVESIGTSFAIYDFNRSGNTYELVTGNHLYNQILNKSIDASIGHNLLMLFPRYIEKSITAAFDECRGMQKTVEIEVVIEHMNTEKWWRIIVSPVISPDGQCLRLINTCVDITEKKLLERQLKEVSKRYEAVVQAAYDGIITIDQNQNISMINDSALYIFGRNGERNSLIGQPLTELIPLKYRAKHREYVESFKSSVVDSRPMQQRAAVRGLKKDGTEFPIEVTISKIAVNNKMEMTAVVRDISERARLVEELSRQAREDGLTGLINRREFTRILNSEIARNKRYKRSTSLLMLDIDNFKDINDSHGHTAGDLVLRSLSQILQENSRDIDIISRWGGEEFLIYLPEVTLESAVIWAERIRNLISASPISKDDTIINITVSIGIVSSNYMETEFNQLINLADEKMYMAKKKGRNRVEY